VVLANYFSPDDFAHKLLEANPEFAVVEYPALIPSQEDPDVLEPLCPEYWTVPALEFKKREVGEQTWFYTWMQEAGSFEDATFRRDALQDARDPEIKIGEVAHAVTDIYIGCDPATAASGYCAIVVWGLDRNSKQRYLIDVFNEKGMRNIDNVVAQLVEMARTYAPRKVIVEGNAQQKAFVNSEQFQRGIRNLGIRYEVYQTVTGSGGRARESNYDITTIGNLFDGGLITLPYAGTDADRARTDAYIDQLVAWRTDDDGNSIKHLVRDMVMATLFAESEAFVLANRNNDRKVQVRSQVTPPKWVRKRHEQLQRQPA
jgi:hypothetical protein